jgi:ABC-2 type transport system permease protein
VVIHLIIKDLKRMARDRKALLITLLMPAVLTLILGMSIGKMWSNELSLTPATVSLVSLGDRDKDLAKLEEFLASGFIVENAGEIDLELFRSDLDRLDPEKILLEEVFQHELVQQIITVTRDDFSTAENKLQRGEIAAIILLPEYFFYDTVINYVTPFRNQINIQVIKNPNQTIKANIVEGILTSFAHRLAAGIIGKNTFLELGVEYSLGPNVYHELESMITLILSSETAEIKVINTGIEGKKKISGVQYYAAGMASMFVLFTAGYSSRYFISERQLFTYQRQLLAGTHLFSMLAARFGATAIFTWGQLLILIVFSSLMLKMDWGAYGGTLMLAGAIALAVGGLAVLLSALNFIVNDHRAASLFENVFVPMMSLVGGSFFPARALPELLSSLGRYTLNGQAMNGFIKLMQGYQLVDITPVIINLGVSSFGLSLLGLLLAWTAIRRT